MEVILALAIAVLVGSGVFLILRARTFPVILGLILFGYGVNLFILASGRLATGRAAIIGHALQPTDPLPQALVLTAIVIGFATTAFVVVLALRSLGESGSDHVDGHADRQDGEGGD